MYLGLLLGPNPLSKANWNLVVMTFDRKLSLWKTLHFVPDLESPSLNQPLIYYLFSVSLLNSWRGFKGIFDEGIGVKKVPCNELGGGGDSGGL